MKLGHSIFFLLFTCAACRIIETSGDTKESGNIVRQETEPLASASEEELEDSTEVILENDLSNDIVSESSELQQQKPQQQKPSVQESETSPVNQNDPDPINRYCSCTRSVCKCCRDFAFPLVPIRGPGCATIRYLEEDRMSVMLKYGDFVLASRTVSGKKATPICLPLPGGYSQFCGRVYGIGRSGDNFKACLGLDLRAEDEIEAALRVSCFNFGPRGVSIGDAEPLPPVVTDEDDEDDDDDDDLLGLGGDDDDDAGDDDDDDDEEGDGGVVGDLLSIVT